MNRVQATKYVFACCCITLLMGCTENLVVGEEEESDEPIEEIEEPTLQDVLARDRFVSRPVIVERADPCWNSDVPRVQFRNDWLARGNEWGSLGGSLWRGSIDLGPEIELAIDPNGSAYVHFGDQDYYPRPTNPEIGWGCDPETYSYDPAGSCASGPGPGVEHPVRGASFDGYRVVMALQAFEPWDEWCSLQSVHEYPDSECFYSSAPPYANVSAGEDGQCSYNGRNATDWILADCMAMDLRSRCECLASGCMAIMTSEEWTTMSFDLRLSADGTTLEGGIKYSETGPLRVQLSRVE